MRSVSASDAAAYDYMRPLAVDLDFVQAVTLPHSVHDGLPLVAFVVQLKIAKHVAAARFAKYFA